MTTDLSHDVDAGADHAPTISTRLLHADRIADVGHGAVHAPMHTSVLYGYGSAQELQEVFQGHKPGFTYARQGNPTNAALEAKLNLLEETRATICFSTGMAAISATFFALLRAGDHVVSSRYVFGNTVGVLRTLEGFGLEVSYVEPLRSRQRCDLTPGSFLWRQSPIRALRWRTLPRSAIFAAGRTWSSSSTTR